MDLGLPPLPPISDRDASLTDNEVSIILDATLKKVRRSDPTVLAFIESFVRCKNIAQASAECGINPGTGYKIRHYVDVSNCIQKLIDKSVIKYGFDATEVMERTKEIVDFDPIVIQNPDGSYKNNMWDIPPEARRNIKKMKVKNLYEQTEDINGIKKNIIVGEVIEIEFYDKLKAIDLVGKEKEMFKTTTRVEHAVTENMANILLEASKRGQIAAQKFIAPRTIEAVVTNVRNEDEPET